MPQAVWVVAPTLLGLLHVALVAPRYHVGSFDDDASYILATKALLAGQGLTGHTASGQVVVALYAPGYGALLAPLLWLWPHTFAPLRLLSVLCYAAVFPLLWLYLGRRGMGTGFRTAALTVLALGPPFATYGSMVMAESPFLAVLMLLLLALDGWVDHAPALSAPAVAVVGLAATLLWLKQAGLGLVVGLVLWLPLSRARQRWQKAAVVAIGVALTTVPVVVARLATGIPLAGGRYSAELGGYYQGGLGQRLLHVLPHSVWQMVSTAVPATLVPYLQPLPIDGPWSVVWEVLSWHVSFLVGLGAVLWFRRHRDVAVAMVVVYLFEAMLWPFVNERRAILVVPLLASWYVIGAVAAWSAARRWRPRRVSIRLGVAVSAVAVALPLLAQMPRDYLYGWGQSSSRFGGSRYTALLDRLGTPADLVETDYQSSTALFTGHLTNWNAFTHTSSDPCSLPEALQNIRADNAGYLLNGDFNKPGSPDSPCLAELVVDGDWAVPLLRTTRDDATVYELVGPGTGHPGLVDATSQAKPASPATVGAESTEQWTFDRPTALTQISVGEAAYSLGPTRSVTVEVRSPGHQWQTLVRARGSVGDDNRASPYLLSSLPDSSPIDSIRVVVDGEQPGGSAVIDDAAFIGPAGGPPTTS